MLASTGDRCGIAAYSRELVRALGEFAEVTVEPIQVGRQPTEHYREQSERLNSADVVHVQHEHSFWGGILPGQSAFWELRYLITKPLVITAHTTTSLAGLLKVREERRPIHRVAKEILLRRRAYRDSIEIAPFVTRGECIVHTEGGRRELVERGALPEHVHVIPAGVPDALPAPTGGASFRERFGLGDRRVVSLFGYIAPNKGYELTLDILPELPQDIAFVVAGGVRTPDMEPYAAGLRNRFQAAGLGDRVTITGYLPDEEVAEAMAASEVVVVPHTQATGSYSVMVPLAYGKPIVASDLDCFKEIWERVPCLRLFRSRDAAHYAACLKAVLGNAVGRQEMSDRAREYAAKHSWREIARRTVEVYRLAMGARVAI